MKLFTFIQLLQGILHKTIDEVEQKANELTEETVEQDEDKLDIAAFDFLINIVTNMKARYIQFKANFDDEPPPFDERVRSYNLSIEDDEDDGDGNKGGLH